MITTTFIFLAAFSFYLLSVARKQHEKISILESFYEASETLRTRQDHRVDHLIKIMDRRLDDLEKKINDRNGFELSTTEKAFSGIRIDVMNLTKKIEEIRAELQEEVETNDSSLKHIEDEVRFLYGLEDRIRVIEEILIYQVSAGSTLAGLKERVNELVQRNDDRANEGEAPGVETGMEPRVDRELERVALVRDL